MSKEGYFIDEQLTNKSYSFIPFIIADKFICGRRIVSGANDIVAAGQVISTLLIAKENITKSIEGPRFLLQNGHITIEGEKL